NCFQLVGFPEWWTDKSKSTGGRGSDKTIRGRGRGGRGSGFRANNATTHESESQPSGIPNFTADQLAALANFLNGQKQSSTEKLSGNSL
ncbi:unnamed protein product, partial [Brassica rapa subsp. narinosa]